VIVARNAKAKQSGEKGDKKTVPTRQERYQQREV
jgi:hypothetical protein